MDVDAAQAEQMLADSDVQLVDVREPYEYEAGRIAGARLIGLSELSGAAESIDRERPVLFYCRVGARSNMAARAFERAGYTAYSMSGGLMSWHASGKPLEPADGTVAAH